MRLIGRAAFWRLVAAFALARMAVQRKRQAHVSRHREETKVGSLAFVASKRSTMGKRNISSAMPLRNASNAV